MVVSPGTFMLNCGGWLVNNRMSVDPYHSGRHRAARAKIASRLREQENKAHRFRLLSHKIKNREELDKEEIKQFNEMTKNTKLEKVLQTNEWIIDTLIKEKFDDPMYYDVFVARCRDIGENITGRGLFTQSKRLNISKKRSTL